MVFELKEHSESFRGRDKAASSVDKVERPARWQFALVAACFLVSGFAALLYETVWLRQFAVLLGTSEQALAIVLASYMGGLAIGSLVSSRYVDSLSRPLLTYGLLELGIAVAALLIPIGLSVARMLQHHWLGGQPEPPPAGSSSQMIFSFVVTCALILIPTSFMGATLPLLARHVVRRDEELGQKIGMLYAINTAGAVLGTMTAAFVLMPSIGLRATTWVGAAANLLVFGLIIALVCRRASLERPEGSMASGQPSQIQSNRKLRRGRDKNRADQAERRLRYGWILWLAGLSGGISFSYEIIFTRMLGHLLGGSVYAFATMLSGFLMGIALGGAIASRFATTRRVAAVGYVYAQVGAGICTLLAFHLLEASIVWPWDRIGTGSSTPEQILASILILLPTATCVGLSFPFAIRALARDQTQAATASAKIYSLSTFGGIFGALLTGTLLLPILQYHGSTTFAIMGNLVIALLAIALIKLPAGHVGAVAVAAGALLLALPRLPENVIRVSSIGNRITDGPILFNHVGKSATVTVFYDQGGFRFQTNGLPEASVLGLGTGDSWKHSGTWLAGLPPVLRDGMESMLIIGLGGGVAASAVPPSIRQIDVVELEGSVIEANRVVASMRNRDPLSDPRLRLILNDARNALALTDRRYDAIVSQPSHPWTAGASHLYTREFAEIAQQHLTSGGIFVQWMGTEFLDSDLLRSMTATLRDVFEHVRIYQPVQGTLLFVASGEPIVPEMRPSLGVADVDRNYYLRMGLVRPEHLLAILSAEGAGVDALAEGAPLILDERNLLAMRAPRLLRRTSKDEVEATLRQVHPLSRGQTHVRELCPTVDFFSFTRRLIDHGSLELARQHGVPSIVPSSRRDFVQAELESKAERDANVARLPRHASRHQRSCRRIQHPAC